MACAIRVQEQNPGDFGWMSCKLLGNSPLFERKTSCFGKKVQEGRGREEEWDRNCVLCFWDLVTVYTDISQTAQGFPDLLWICKKNLKFQHSGHIQLQPFCSFRSYVEPKPEIAPKTTLRKKDVWLLSTAGCDQYWIWCVTMMRVLPWSCLQMTDSKT